MVLFQNEAAIGNQAPGDGNTQPASQMVVAGACRPQRRVFGADKQARRWGSARSCGELHQGFDQARGLHRSQTVVAVAPGRGDAQQLRIEQLRQMRAGTGSTDARGTCEFRSGESSSTHQLDQHGCTGRLADQRGNAGDLVSVQGGNSWR